MASLINDAAEALCPFCAHPMRKVTLGERELVVCSKCNLAAYFGPTECTTKHVTGPAEPTTAERILAAIDERILEELDHSVPTRVGAPYEREEERLMDLCRARLAIVQSMPGYRAEHDRGE